MENIVTRKEKDRAKVKYNWSYRTGVIGNTTRAPLSQTSVERPNASSTQCHVNCAEYNHVTTRGAHVICCWRADWFERHGPACLLYKRGVVASVVWGFAKCWENGQTGFIVERV